MGRKVLDSQTTYHTVVAGVQAAIDKLQSMASSDQARERATPSPTPFFHLHCPASHVCSNTNLPPPSSSNQERYQQLANALFAINSKYRISWERPEMLIELSGGNPSASLSNAPSSVRSPQLVMSSVTSQVVAVKAENALLLSQVTRVSRQYSTFLPRGPILRGGFRQGGTISAIINWPFYGRCSITPMGRLEYRRMSLSIALGTGEMR